MKTFPVLRNPQAASYLGFPILGLFCYSVDLQLQVEIDLPLWTTGPGLALTDSTAGTRYRGLP